MLEDRGMWCYVRQWAVPVRLRISGKISSRKVAAHL